MVFPTALLLAEWLHIRKLTLQTTGDFIITERLYTHHYNKFKQSEMSNICLLNINSPES